jgi:uncharacterized membrane protein YphA (DoxX/SURF4 family)
MEPFLWQIHFLSALSPTFLRLIVGCYFLYIAWFVSTEKDALMQIRGIPLVGHMQSWMIPVSVFFTGLIGALLIIGLQTGVAALVGIILCIKHWYGTRDYAQYLPFSKATYILLLALCLSLLITGPGLFAVDSPLY